MKKQSIVISIALFLFIIGPSLSYGKTLKVGVVSDQRSLDPYYAVEESTFQYNHIVFDPLVRWKQDMTIEPRLAEKWERVNDLTMRFHLRRSVKFHSGALFTAKDVKWTIERLKKAKGFEMVFQNVDTPRIVDEHTIDIITKNPEPLLLNLATQIFPMDSEYYSGVDDTGNPKDAIVYAGPSFALSNASGTGPFVVTYREHGIKTVYKRFREYWDKNSPGNINEIILTPIKTDSTRIAALLAGDVDLIMPVPPQDYDRIKSDVKLKLVTMPSTRIILFQLDQQRRPEFRDRRVRLAIIHSVNNEGVAQHIMKGTSTPTGQLSPEGYQGYKPSLTPRYDVKKALTLMKEAGYEKGFEVSMIAPNDRYVNDSKIAEAVSSMLAKINIKVNLQTMSKTQYWPQYRAFAADIQMLGWQAPTEDSVNNFESIVMCPDTKSGMGFYNSARYCNPNVDELVIKARTEVDIKVRKLILQEIEQILYDDAATLPIHWQHHSWACKTAVLLKPIANSQNLLFYGDLVLE